MGKTLIITEKPSVARDISRCLGGFSSKQGYYESDTFLLSWSYGHLVEIAAPEIEGGKWTPEQLPLFPQFILRVMERGQEQFAVSKRPDAPSGILESTPVMPGARENLFFGISAWRRAARNRFSGFGFPA
ncbi:MAG: hypothetical protein ACOX5W_05255 [Bacillota bacterium]